MYNMVSLMKCLENVESGNPESNRNRNFNLVPRVLSLHESRGRRHWKSEDFRIKVIVTFSFQGPLSSLQEEI